MNQKQWCWDCKNSIIYPGHNGFRDEPPVADELECQVEDINFETLDLAFDTAVKLGADIEYPENGFYGAHCGYFNPKVFKKCGCCELEMNVPQHTWKLTWTPMYGMETVPCCSKECKEKLVEGELKQHKENNEQQKIFLEEGEWA
ncbi:hypothetical protein D3C71_948620 [compost metagenome]